MCVTLIDKFFCKYLFKECWQLVLKYAKYQVGSVKIWQVFSGDAWRP